MDIYRLGQIFNSPVTENINRFEKKSSKDRDPSQQQHQKQQKEEQATEEEAQKAKKFLENSSAVKNNNLKIEILAEGENFQLLVKDASGKKLKTMNGYEIHILIANSNQTDGEARILDRRI